jgi:hypothetical protein
VLKDDKATTKASAYCGGLILKQTDMKECYGVPHTNQPRN